MQQNEHKINVQTNQLDVKINLDKMRWYNSSNVLCNYMKKQEFLEKILYNMAIIPRYVIEPVNYLDLRETKKICFPMTCFCDIPLSKVNTHMSNYGRYGIGLDKISILDQYGVQPIQYINAKSPLADDFKEAFRICVDNKFEGKEATLASYLSSSLMYMKPIYNYEQGDEGKAKTYVFQDECEWRYIPSKYFPKSLPLILPQNQTSEKAKDKYSAVLAKHPECWLKFGVDDVRYIIVPNESASKSIIDIIRNLSLNSHEKDVLISKIEISRTFSENM